MTRFITNLVEQPSFDGGGLHNWRFTGAKDRARIGNWFISKMWGGSTGRLLYGAMADDVDEMTASVELAGVAPGDWVGVRAQIAIDRNDKAEVALACTTSTGVKVQTAAYPNAAYYTGAHPRNVWQVPPGTTKVELQFTARRTGHKDTSRLWVDRVLAVAASSEEDAWEQTEEYFDGESEYAQWLDTPYASKSRLDTALARGFAPRVRRAKQQVPSIELLFEGLPEGTATITLWRFADGTQKRVRGAVEKTVADGFSVIDYEAPFGVPVAYRAECFDATGQQIAWTETATTSLDEPGMWIHNPLDPQGATRVEFTAAATREITYPNLGESLQMAGERAVLFMAGTQAGIRGVDLSIATDTVADRDRVMTMLGWRDKPLPPILCYRIGANHRVPLPRTFFAAVPEMVMRDVNVVWGGSVTHFVGEGDETLPPAEGIVTPTLTYGHVNASYSKYRDLNRHYGALGEINRDYQLAQGE